MTDDTRAPLTAQEITELREALEWFTKHTTRRAARSALRALDELEALREAEEKRQRIGTHGPGCYGWGYRHYECALRRIDDLAAAVRGRIAAGHNDTCGAVLSSGDGVFACGCGHSALAAAFEEPGDADT